MDMVKKIKIKHFLTIQKVGWLKHPNPSPSAVPVLPRNMTSSLHIVDLKEDIYPPSLSVRDFILESYGGGTQPAPPSVPEDKKKKKKRKEKKARSRYG